MMDKGEPPEVGSEARKPCIACREPIPVTAAVCSHCHERQLPEKPVSVKKIGGWVAAITALIGVFASLFGGVQWIKDHWTQRSDIRTELAVAESQTKRGVYEMAVATYQGILKKDPQNQQAADGQVNATMRWVENFSVLTHEGENAADIASPKLDAIMPILDAGLARAEDGRAADILAHIGWVHWLNRHIAQREFGPAAEQSFRRALEIDPSNVYANAMLGNWLLQTNGSMPDAFRHFATAVQSGEERPWVRTMQLGGLIYNDDPQARTELIRVVNDMRKNNELLDEGNKGRILSFNYNVSPRQSEELSLALSAVPPDESWATYQWLDDGKVVDQIDINEHRLRHEYIHVRILELSGKRQQALDQYKSLQAKLEKYPGYVLIHSVENAIARLAAN